MFTRCTACVVFGGRLETGEGGPGGGLRLGGGFEVVGIVYGEIKTSPGFCRSYYGDVVLVEARRLCYVWCRLETGRGSPETLSCGVPAINSLVNT